ncbi:MAG: Mutual gliding-motility protein MglA, partial [uncultured Thermomicrobiales bacterium]
GAHQRGRARNPRQDRLLRSGPVRQNDQPPVHPHQDPGRDQGRPAIDRDRDRAHPLFRFPAPGPGQGPRVHDPLPPLHRARADALRADPDRRPQRRRRRRLRRRCPPRPAAGQPAIAARVVPERLRPGQALPRLPLGDAVQQNGPPGRPAGAGPRPLPEHDQGAPLRGHRGQRRRRLRDPARDLQAGDQQAV